MKAAVWRVLLLMDHTTHGTNQPYGMLSENSALLVSNSQNNSAAYLADQAQHGPFARLAAAAAAAGLQHLPLPLSSLEVGNSACIASIMGLLR